MGFKPCLDFVEYYSYCCDGFYRGLYNQGINKLKKTNRSLVEAFWASQVYDFVQSCLIEAVHAVLVNKLIGVLDPEEEEEEVNEKEQSNS